MARVPVVEHFKASTSQGHAGIPQLPKTYQAEALELGSGTYSSSERNISTRGSCFQTPSSPPNIIENTPASLLVCSFIEIELDTIYTFSHRCRHLHYEVRDRDRRTSLTSPILSRPQITMYPKSGWRHVRPNRAEPGRSWWLRCQFSP